MNAAAYTIERYGHMTEHTTEHTTERTTEHTTES